MVNIEERVRIVEARMVDHGQLLADLRQGLLRFEERVDRRFAQIDARLLALEQKFEMRIGVLEQKFEMRIGVLEEKFETRMGGLEQRFETRMGAFDQKIDTGLAAQTAEIAALRRDITTLFTTQFRWTAGIMITGVMAIVAAILAG